MNAERLLRSLVKNSMGGRRGRRRKKSSLGGLMTGKVGLGALGVAIAAFEHFTKGPDGGQSGASAPTGSPRSGGPASAPVPSGPPSVAPPPPPPSAPPSAPAAAAVPPPLPSAESSHTIDDSLILIRAMIAAAYADGAVSEEERDAMQRALTESGGSADDLAALERELERPLNVDGLVALVTEHGEREDLATQIYASSLLAIEVDTDEERDYLRRLRLGLGLREDQVAALHEQFDVVDSL